MTDGIVVKHRDLPDTYFAIPAENFDAAIHTKVRDLRPGESVRSYLPKRHVDYVAERTFDEQVADAADETIVPDEDDETYPDAGDDTNEEGKD